MPAFTVLWKQVHKENNIYRPKATFTSAKLQLNEYLKKAEVGDYIGIYKDGIKVYMIYNEGIHKGKIMFDETGPDWV